MSLVLTNTDYSKSIWDGLWQQMIENKLYTSQISLSNRSIDGKQKGQIINVHSFILSAVSPVFKKMIDTCNSSGLNVNNSILSLDMSYENMEKMVRFVYNREMSLEEHNEPSFQQTLELYQISKGVPNPRHNFLRKSMIVERHEY